MLSRGTSIILLLTYIGYLIFQLRTHSQLFEAEASEEEEEPDMDAYSSGAWLVIITVITSFAADILVGSIDETAQQYHIPKRFIGLILLPLVGNAAEHVTSVWMACKGKMEITLGVAVGSSIQIAAGMIPLLVIIAWPLQKDLTLFFVSLVDLLADHGMLRPLRRTLRQSHCSFPSCLSICCYRMVAPTTWRVSCVSN